jgi:hypothetical protein
MIVSFDIGKKNFAFVVEEENDENDEKNGKIILFKNLDLTIDTNKKLYLDPKIFHNMYTELEKYTSFWEKCNVILIEKQMSFRGKRNTMALKLGQHCYSYFVFKYGTTKKIIEFPAYHKTQVLGAPKKQTKNQRKKWAIEKAQSILAQRGDYENLVAIFHERKLDDICDCILMNIAYIMRKKKI